MSCVRILDRLQKDEAVCHNGCCTKKTRGRLCWAFAKFLPPFTIHVNGIAFILFNRVSKINKQANTKWRVLWTLSNCSTSYFYIQAPNNEWRKLEIKVINLNWLKLIENITKTVSHLFVSRMSFKINAIRVIENLKMIDSADSYINSRMRICILFVDDQFSWILYVHHPRTFSLKLVTKISTDVKNKINKTLYSQE